MNIQQTLFYDLEELNEYKLDFKADIFFVFISPLFEASEQFIKELSAKFPECQIIGCSTAGEIIGNEVVDNSIALTAVRFEKTKLKLVDIDLADNEMDSFKTGKAISNALKDDGLRHMFVLSDGLFVNGAELVKGLHDGLDKTISITGGLAGDGSDFKNTFVVFNNTLKSKHVVALGLYGEALNIGFASKGGWDSFGVERLVTKSQGNVLYELDGEPALDLYKSYLGEKSKELPASGLLFPLSMRNKDHETPVVRTILGINEEEKSLTFAGNITQGSYVRLMKANIDRIINGAEQSAVVSKKGMQNEQQLAFLISCVGRRLVLKQLVEEEVEAVNDVLGQNIKTTGFYSYGEIAPFDKFSQCELHNQTMTITTFSE